MRRAVLALVLVATLAGCGRAYHSTDGAKIVQYTCSSQLNGRWRFVARDGGYWELWNMASGKLTPREALRIATIKGADDIGRARSAARGEIGNCLVGVRIIVGGEAGERFLKGLRVRPSNQAAA